MTGWATVLHQGGHQLSHIHPGGWLSGVYYVKVPADGADEGDPHAAEIEFGRPPGNFALAREPRVTLRKPQEGLLLLFPAYLYHRTIPTVTEELRISIAFDVLAQA